MRATTVSRTDSAALRAHPFFVRFWTGLRRPRRTVLGMDFAGEVEAVGEGVASFTPGDRVFGLSPGGYGAHAEYLCVAETGQIATMPAGVRFDQAVVCEGALYANTYLRGIRSRARPQDPDLRRVRGDRNGRGTTCQILRG